MTKNKARHAGHWLGMWKAAQGGGVAAPGISGGALRPAPQLGLSAGGGAGPLGITATARPSGIYGASGARAAPRKPAGIYGAGGARTSATPGQAPVKARAGQTPVPKAKAVTKPAAPTPAAQPGFARRASYRGARGMPMKVARRIGYLVGLHKAAEDGKQPEIRPEVFGQAAGTRPSIIKDIFPQTPTGSAVGHIGPRKKSPGRPVPKKTRMATARKRFAGLTPQKIAPAGGLARARRRKPAQ